MVFILNTIKLKYKQKYHIDLIFDLKAAGQAVDLRLSKASPHDIGEAFASVIYRLSLLRSLAANSSAARILNPVNRVSVSEVFRGLWSERVSMRWSIFVLFAQ